MNGGRIRGTCLSVPQRGDGTQIKMIVLHNLTRVEKIRRDLHVWTLSGGRTQWKEKGEEREALSDLTAWAGEARAE